jgi:hypothetical protein
MAGREGRLEVRAVAGGLRRASCSPTPRSIVLWAECDPADTDQFRRFRAVNTGEDVPAESLSYAGTIQMRDSGIVWHIYELAPLPAHRAVDCAPDGALTTAPEGAP